MSVRKQAGWWLRVSNGDVECMQGETGCPGRVAPGGGQPAVVHTPGGTYEARLTVARRLRISRIHGHCSQHVTARSWSGQSACRDSFRWAPKVWALSNRGRMSIPPSRSLRPRD
jgi:hypothetical protein